MGMLATWLTNRMDKALHPYQCTCLSHIVKVDTNIFLILHCRGRQTVHYLVIFGKSLNRLQTVTEKQHRNSASSCLVIWLKNSENIKFRCIKYFFTGFLRPLAKFLSQQNDFSQYQNDAMNFLVCFSQNQKHQQTKDQHIRLDRQCLCVFPTIYLA